MDLSEVIRDAGGQAGLARLLGCNKSYINRASKRGRVGAALAVRIYRKTGHKIGPIEGATPKQIEAIERLSVKDCA